MGTELMKIEEYAIAKNPGSLGELLQANLGGGKLNAWDMETVKFPSGESTTWSLPDVTSESGKKDAKELTGVILHYKDVRRFWALPYGEAEASAPDCMSHDLEYGEGEPGGECKSCPEGTWEEGSPTCKIAKDMLILLPDAMLPVNLSIGPGSYTNLKKYFLKLVSAGVPYWKAVTTISLSTALSKGKKKDIAYPKANARMVQLIEDEAILDAVGAYRKLLHNTVPQD